MAVFKSVKDMDDFVQGVKTAGKIAGAVRLAMNPTPLGVGMAVADTVLQKTTGRTAAQHVLGSIQGPATSTSTAVGRNKKGDVVAEGGSFRDPEQKDISRSAKAKGGLVSYKDIGHMHTKVCGHK